MDLVRLRDAQKYRVSDKDQVRSLSEIRLNFNFKR